MPHMILMLINATMRTGRMWLPRIVLAAAAQAHVRMAPLATRAPPVQSCLPSGIPVELRAAHAATRWHTRLATSTTKHPTATSAVEKPGVLLPSNINVGCNDHFFARVDMRSRPCGGVSPGTDAAVALASLSTPWGRGATPGETALLRTRHKNNTAAAATNKNAITDQDLQFHWGTLSSVNRGYSIRRQQIGSANAFRRSSAPVLGGRSPSEPAGNQS